MFCEMQLVRLAPRVWQTGALLFGDGGDKCCDRLIETSAGKFARIKGHKELAVVDGLVVRIGP